MNHVFVTKLGNIEKLKGIMKKSKELSENIARLNRKVSLSTEYLVTLPLQKKIGMENTINTDDREGTDNDKN